MVNETLHGERLVDADMRRALRRSFAFYANADNSNSTQKRATGRTAFSSLARILAAGENKKTIMGTRVRVDDVKGQDNVFSSPDDILDQPRPGIAAERR
jgi:hypothetical protein